MVSYQLLVQQNCLTRSSISLKADIREILWVSSSHQGEREPEENAGQLDGSVERRLDQRARPHRWRQQVLGGGDHPQCDRATSDGGSCLWIWKQQCHFTKKISRWEGWSRIAFVQVLFSDVDQLSSSIDRELLDTMKKLFGWDCLLCKEKWNRWFLFCANSNVKKMNFLYKGRQSFFCTGQSTRQLWLGTRTHVDRSTSPI